MLRVREKPSHCGIYILLLLFDIEPQKWVSLFLPCPMQDLPHPFIVDKFTMWIFFPTKFKNCHSYLTVDWWILLPKIVLYWSPGSNLFFSLLMTSKHTLVHI